MDLQVSNKTYDFLNALVRMVLPGLGTLYFALAAIWDLPHAENVVGTIVAIATFLGVVINLARRGWVVDDELYVHRDPEDGISFGFKDDPRLIEHLETGQTVTLKVSDMPEDMTDPGRGSF